MKISPTATINDEKLWGSHGKSFTFSSTGQFVAVKIHDTLRDGDDHHNIFVYNFMGIRVWSTRTLSSGETGIAFFPDNHHIVVSGCEDRLSPNRKDRDGIKKWEINGDDYELIFDNTPMTGINVHIHGASDNGKTLLAKKPASLEGLYCLQIGKEYKLPDIPFSEAYFSPNGDFLVVVYFILQKQSFIKLVEPIEINGVPVNIAAKALDDETYGFMPSEADFVCFINDQEFVTTKDNMFYISNTNTYQLLKEFNADKKPSGHVLAGTYSPSKNLIATAHSDGTVSIWDYTDFLLKGQTKLVNEHIAARLKFTNDGKHLLAIGMMKNFEREAVYIWKID